jgi:hypothetical protein
LRIVTHTIDKQDLSARSAAGDRAESFGPFEGDGRCRAGGEQETQRGRHTEDTFN